MVKRSLLAALVVGAASLVSSGAQCPTGTTARSKLINLESNPGTGESSQTEVSGVAHSTQVVNGEAVVWVISDGPGDSHVTAYGVNTRDRLARVDFGPSRVSGGVTDYEELTLGPCSSSVGGPTCLFVGAFGNNNARDKRGQSGREVSQIYRFAEPSLPSTISTSSPRLSTVSNAAVIPFKYDQSGMVAADCESMFSDPLTGDLFLLTKWNSADRALARVFRVPAGASHNVQLSLRPLSSNNSILRSKTWTRGAISKDGSLIAQGSTGQAYFWTRGSGETVEQAMNREPCFSMNVQVAAQHEALTFGNSGEVYEIPEGNDPGLYFTRLVFPSGPSPVASPVPSPMAPPPAGSSPAVVRVSEEAEESAGGRSYITSRDLEFGYDADNENSNQLVCMRFTGVGVPPGATVSSATIKFVGRDDASTGSPVLTCFGEKTANAAPLTDAANNLSDRASRWTTTRVPWSPPHWDNDATVYSPDLKAAVQEIVAVSNGWALNNAMVLCCQKAPGDTSTSNRRAYSTKGTTNQAWWPELSVAFAAAPSPNPVPSPVPNPVPSPVPNPVPNPAAGPTGSSPSTEPEPVISTTTLVVGGCALGLLLLSAALVIKTSKGQQMYQHARYTMRMGPPPQHWQQNGGGPGGGMVAPGGGQPYYGGNPSAHPYPGQYPPQQQYGGPPPQLWH